LLPLITCDLDNGIFDGSAGGVRLLTTGVSTGVSTDVLTGVSTGVLCS
jgi:hypothetical protein